MTDKPRHQAASEDLAHKQALIAEARVRRAKEEAKVRRAWDALLRTEDGRIVWADLFRFCGYNRSAFAVDPATGELQPLASAHNETLRSVYVELRRKVSPAVLAPVEFAAEFEGIQPPAPPKEK